MKFQKHSQQLVQFLQSGHISSLSTSSPQAGHSFVAMFSPLQNYCSELMEEVYKFYFTGGDFYKGLG